MLSSMAGVIIALTLLGYAFHLAEAHSPAVTHGGSSTCPAPDCSTCLHQVRWTLLFVLSVPAVVPSGSFPLTASSISIV